MPIVGGLDIHWKQITFDVTAHLAEPADTAFARGRKRHAKCR
jgi:hypothetical protein